MVRPLFHHGTTVVPLDHHRPGQTRRETATQSQGSPPGDRPAAGDDRQAHNHKVGAVKANLARFTFAVTLLATMAMSLGAGIKWFWD
jgi:hypothetical protein